MCAFHGTASVGERGQIVIPKKARAKLGIQKGDDFLVIEKESMILLVPTDVAETMLHTLTTTLKKIQN